MCEVNFYDPQAVSDHRLRYVVIVASYHGKWIFCRHQLRNTWEIPGGHREINETIEEAAYRELFEETGAVNAKLCRVAVYGVKSSGEETFGMLFCADINELLSLDGRFEIAEIILCDSLPCDLTYPRIQPYLFDYVLKNRTVLF